jgi:hypothetical protein
MMVTMQKAFGLPQLPNDIQKRFQQQGQELFSGLIRPNDVDNAKPKIS